MKLEPRLLTTSFRVLILAAFSAGHANGGTIESVSRAVRQTSFGYHGPLRIGPFSIDNKVGGSSLRKLLPMIGGPTAPRGMYDCYYDKFGKAYLVVERGADNSSLVRGVTVSRMNLCPVGKMNHASGFSRWATEHGIRLGSSMKKVVTFYGEPSRSENLRADPNFTFSPYDLKRETPGLPNDGRILSYLPNDGEPDTSHAFFGIRKGVVVWMTLSDNE